MKEHLVRINLEKGGFIDFYRDHDGNKISLCSGEHCVNLPELTGLQTTELFSLLEPLGEKIEFPPDEESSLTIDVPEDISEPI